MNKVNNELKRVIGIGNKLSMPLHKQIQITNEFDYCHFIRTHYNIFTLVTKNGSFECHVNEVDWTIFWDALTDIPVDENDCIEQPFEHFEIGTDREDIWHWFEWYFDISLGKAIENEIIDG